MKLSIKIFLKDLSAVLILGSIAAFFSYLLYMNFQQEVSRTDGLILGRVNFISDKPVRKFSNRSIWGNLDQDSPIYSYDTIKTDENDRVSILLKDNTEITLESNSMIIIEDESILFNNGTISAISPASSGNPLSIKSSNGSAIHLQSGILNISQDASGQMTYNVAQGQAKYSSSEGIYQTIGDNQYLTIGSDGNSKGIMKQKIKLQAPFYQQYFITLNPQEDISFSWEINREMLENYLIISRNPSMEDPFFNQRIQGENTELTLNQGRYYWQIINQEEKSSISTFQIIQEELPLPQYPLGDQEINYRSQAPFIHFNWQPGKYSTKYLLQVAGDSSFTHVLREIEIEDTSYFTKEFSAGQYWWRVKAYVPFNGGYWMDFTEPESFSILQKLEIDNTILISPSDDSALTTLRKEEGLRFIWKADNEAEKFTFLLSKDRNMSNIIDQQEIHDSYYFRELPVQGDYYWTIKGYTFDNIPLPPSPVYHFSVREVKGTIIYQQPLSDENLIKEKSELQSFSWDSIEDGFFRFRLWYQPLSQQQEIMIADNLTKNHSILAVLPGAGIYRWQVALVNEANNVIDQGEDRYFKSATPFLGPSIKAPAPDAQLRLIGIPRLTIEWDANSEADFYQGSIYKEKSSTPLISRDSIDETQWVIEDFSNMEAGNYRLEIRGGKHNPMDEEGAFSEPSISYFQIKELSIYSPIELLSPGYGQVYEIPQLLKTPLTLSWKGDPEIQEYEIMLFGSESQSVPIYYYNTQRNYYSPPELPPGIYYWEVSGKDSAGYEAPGSLRKKFQILPLQTLSRPVLSAPIKDSVVDMTDSDSLDFQWEAVSGAEYYQLKLFNSEEILIFQKSRITEPFYSLRDLTLLDIGDFYVEISAEKYLADVDLQISSLPLKSSFTITLDQEYTIPEIISPDVQFTE